jgi:hypothetical protein
MVCAKYRNLAHISHIYQSSDPSQPKVFHGNTCAHEINIVSTASVLPRTPADINGILSVIFVGPGKLKLEDVRPLFLICKHKVWQFLLWLKAHNHLYTDIPLDSTILDNYPDSGVIPGIDHCIFQEHELNVSETFGIEMAGFSEHPAELVREGDESMLLLARKGVLAVKLSGRTFVVSTLKNLVSNAPDLIIH